MDAGYVKIRKSEFGILDKEGNDMNKLMTAIAAALVAMVIAAPVAAQWAGPTVQMLANANNRCANGCNEDDQAACLQTNLAIAVGVGFDGNMTSPTALNVRVLARTRSGHDRFRDYGVPVWINGDDPRTINSLTAVPVPANDQTMYPAQTNGSPGPLCWKDDYLVTGDSEVEVFIVGGSGYWVNPASNSIRFTIKEDDVCATPGENLLYKPMNGSLNDMCLCATEMKAMELNLKPHEMCSDSPWKG